MLAHLECPKCRMLNTVVIDVFCPKLPIQGRMRCSWCFTEFMIGGKIVKTMAEGG